MGKYLNEERTQELVDGVKERLAGVERSFVGTQEAWDELTDGEKAKYTLVNITDDGETGDVVDVVENGNMNPVTSNAVYEATKPWRLVARANNGSYIMGGTASGWFELDSAGWEEIDNGFFVNLHVKAGYKPRAVGQWIFYAATRGGTVLMPAYAFWISGSNDNNYSHSFSDTTKADGFTGVDVMYIESGTGDLMIGFYADSEKANGLDFELVKIS